jgi:GMP synthase (glutamine-hydrolysing)
MILIINNRSHFIKDLELSAKKLGVKSRTIDKSDISTIRDFKKYKGVIMSGGPLLLEKKIYVEDITTDLAWLLQFKGPILGICLGHQIIADAFGGDVTRLKKMVNKEEDVTLLKRGRLFKGLSKNIKVREVHHDGVTRMPANFTLLASSKSVRCEAMEHKERPIFSTQFHPEVSGKTGLKILKNFLVICGEL